MANTGMNVHVLLDGVAPMEQDAIEPVVSRVLSLAPQLSWEESVTAGGYITRHPTPVPGDVLLPLPAAHEAPLERSLAQALAAPLADRGRASFQVVWQPPRTLADGDRALVAFHTTHGILEGGDVAGILRQRSSDRAQRDSDDIALPRPKRLLASVLVPFLWVIHLLIALTEKRNAQDFRYHRIALDRESVKRAANRLGASQRALMFALVSQTYRQHAKPGKAVSVVYSTLPTRRARLVDDEYMNVRADEIRLQPKESLGAYVRHVDEILRRRGPNPLFLATLQRKLLRLHRWVHARAPWVFPRKFFGFSPQDLILSMIPPVNPAGFDPHLEGARMFAGSNTGTANNCIFVPSAQIIGATFWTDIPPDVLNDQFEALCRQLDITTAPALSDPA